ncbi:MAG: helix-turn-helix domain-containing protein [Bacteroidota bacterium]
MAYDTGFSSAVSFNRVFKKITGKSPKQYLREYNQKVD